MCACQPGVRTPNCGKMSCLTATAKKERVRIAAWLRLEMAEWPADDRLPSLVEDLETGAWEKLLAGDSKGGRDG